MTRPDKSLALCLVLNLWMLASILAYSLLFILPKLLSDGTV